MGLDVYLYKKHCSEDEIKSFEIEIDRLREAAWPDKPYEKLTDSEKESAREKSESATATLVDERRIPVFTYGESYTITSYGEERVEQDSKQFPDHMFKVGYFRSSYNDGGMESIARKQGLPGLGGVFLVGDDTPYSFTPEWSSCRDRAAEAVEEWQQEHDRRGGYSIFEYSNPLGEKVSTQREALDSFLEQVPRWNEITGDEWSSYENSNGLFFRESIEVSAIIDGTRQFLGRRDPCVYVVTKDSDHDDSGLKWYIRAMQIVVETCDFVLSQEDPQSYWLHWSS